MRKHIGMLLVLVILLSTLSFASVKHASGLRIVGDSWATRASMNVARSDLGVAVVDRKIYAIGGSAIKTSQYVTLPTSGTVVGTNEEYSPETNTWIMKASMPTARAYFFIAAYQNKIYCIGGAPSFSSVSKEEITGVNEVYNPQTNTWTTFSPMPIARSTLIDGYLYGATSGQANVLNGKIYIIGGVSNATINGIIDPNANSAEVYDPINDSWIIASIPAPTSDSYASTTYDNKIYAANNLELYNYGTDNWNQVASVPSLNFPPHGYVLHYNPSIAATTGIMAPRQIYIFRGVACSMGNVESTRSYDPQNNSFMDSNTMPTFRMDFGVAVVDDKLYVIGGFIPVWSATLFDLVNDTPTAVNEEYTPFGYGTVPPTIFIVSPPNGSYLSNNVTLTFTLNQPTNSLSYSLDGSSNITVNSNITLTGLSNGLHNATIYANDTFGNVGASQTIGFTISNSETFPIVLIVAVTTAILVVAIAGLLVYFKKRKIKRGAILLCFLLCSTIFLATISSVDATSRGAAIWGARSSGAINSPQSESWRKTDGEIFYQWSIAVNLNTIFQNNGYSTVNHQGSQSTKTQILYDMNCYWGLASNFDYFAMVDFDHGVGNEIVDNEMHYMLEDDYGTEFGTYTDYYNDPPSHTNINEGVYDMEIYNKIDPSKVIFAFINTCMSAEINGQGLIPITDRFASWTQGKLPDGNARGMPFAFTHRWVESKDTLGFNITQDQNPDYRNWEDVGDISDDGYGNPDNGGNVYLGFPWGSAAIEQHIPYETNGPIYWIWLMRFFDLAFFYDYSVNQALDIASDWTWGCGTFANSPLQYFRSNWPERAADGNWYNSGTIGDGSRLAVYGNGNIHMKQYEPNYVSWPAIAGDSAGNIYQNLNIYAVSTSPSGHQVHYVFDWGDGSNQYWTPNFCNSGTWVGAPHSWSSGGIYTVTVWAQSDDGTWSSSNTFQVNIGNQPIYHSLTVLATDYYTALNPNVLIDGILVGTAPVTISEQEGLHYIQFEDPVWNSQFYTYADLQSISSDDCYNVYYGNSVPIYHDITTTALYYP
jgi:hypothetical protein